jgi:hypothetical protein
MSTANCSGSKALETGNETLFRIIHRTGATLPWCIALQAFLLLDSSLEKALGHAVASFYDLFPDPRAAERSLGSRFDTLLCNKTLLRFSHGINGGKLWLCYRDEAVVTLESEELPQWTFSINGLYWPSVCTAAQTIESRLREVQPTVEWSLLQPINSQPASLCVLSSAIDNSGY